MKLLNKCLPCLFAPLCAFGQEAVSAGAGSYAEYPADDTFYAFATTTNLMVKAGETRPLPTNDWWTNWLYSESDKLGGRIWAYPLAIDPASGGINLSYPFEWNDSGTSMQTDGEFQFTGTDFSPDESVVLDWSDWTVTAGFTDGEQSLRLTAGHGMPFVWLETSNFMPQIEFDSVSFSDAAGDAVSFPSTANHLAFSSGGAQYGLHVPDGTVLDYSGTEMMTIDLGAELDIDEIILYWQNAYGSAYLISFSDDNENYSQVVNVTDGDGGTDTHSVTGTARYVQISFVEKATAYPYSLWEVEIMSGGENAAENQPITVTSENDYRAENAVDGSYATRWQASSSSDPTLTITYPETNGYVVISALTDASDLTLFDQYARTKPTDTTVSWNHDVTNGTLTAFWNVSTVNLDTGETGTDDVLQGFIPHHYRDGTAGFDFSGHEFSVARGLLKLAAGNGFSFEYAFGGILPHISMPVRDSSDETPYDELIMTQLLSEYTDSVEAKTTQYGTDTYWGGKDLVRIGRYMLIAKELGHEDYDTLRGILEEAFDDWLTYTPGEESRFFAWYPKWKALVGFNESYYSGYFTDNHFHYGYFIQAAALLSMCDLEFVQQYEEMLTLIAKQYANWDHDSTMFPFMRTMDPWIGHSYASGLSAGNGNNQESTSEAMQSWAGLYLLGSALGNEEMRAAGAFGYSSESRATMEYWFDLYGDIFPDGYDHPLVGILWNAGNAYGTYFGADPIYIHGIQMLPYGTYMNYLAKGWDRTSAAEHYDDLLVEQYEYLVGSDIPSTSNTVAELQEELETYEAIENPTDEEQEEMDSIETSLYYAELSLTNKMEEAEDGEITMDEIGKDWGNVILGWYQIFNPEAVTELLADYWVSDDEDEYDFIHDPYTSGLTYYYAHASQHYGTPDFDYTMDAPCGQAFYKESTGETTFIVYNPETNAVSCTVYKDGAAVDAFTVPARSTYNSRYTDGMPTNSLPDGWYHADVGAVSAAGDASALGAAITIDSAGSGAGGTNDAFHMVYQTGSGDLTALARIASLDGDGVGVMMRDSLDADARNVYIGLTAGGSLELQYRTESGADTVTANTLSGRAAPLWLKLQRDGGLFTAAYSPDGENWTEFGSVTAELNDELYGGAAAVSGSAVVSSMALAQFTTASNGVVQAEDYSDAYGVQAEATQDVGGGENIGYITAGDWMSYTLNIATSGIYTISFRLASPNTERQFEFTADGELLGTVDVPYSGTFQSWTNAQLENVSLSAGIQTFMIEALDSSWNINWFAFTYVGPLDDAEAQVPTGLSASDAAAADRIELEWGPVEGEYAYSVWRSADTNPANASVIASGCYNTCTDTNVSAGETYTYWAALQGRTGTAWFSDPDEGSTQGTPQAWQDANYPESYPGDAADSDADGFSSLEEYIADTDPNNSNSFFRITSVEWAAQTNLVVRWNTVTGRQYTVKWAPALSTNFTAVQSAPYSTDSYTNQAAPDEPAGFFQIEVSLEP